MAKDNHNSPGKVASESAAAPLCRDSVNDTVPILETRALCKVYRLEKHTVTVLKGVTFSIPVGEWTALVGRSGSGKTTLLHLLGSLDEPSSGDVLCRGRSYMRLSSRRKAALRRDEIGYVFQSYYLFPELNAWENVTLPALQWGWDLAKARERARQLLVDFGLEHRLRHRPQELSGGEQQRVALARALTNSPEIILADEPTGNLDIAASSEIVAILQRLHQEQGKTIVMATHDLKLAALADRVMLMRDGVASAVPAGTDLEAVGWLR